MSGSLACPTPSSARPALGPTAMLRSLWKHRELTAQLAARQVRARYKDQALGLAWALLDPLVTLAIFTLVFGVIFQRAGQGDPSRGGIARYALDVYAGLLVFALFRDTVAAAPTLITSQRSFVKKVVYPLETIPVSQLLVSAFNLAVGLGVWLLGYIIFSQTHIPGPRLLLLPIVVLPVALLALGLSWILAALGVFLRDLRNPVASILQMLFFLSAIFYRVEDVPEPWRRAIEWNPLAQVVTSARGVMFAEGWPAWGSWALTLGAGLLACIAGHAFFMKSRKAFADVI